MKTGDLVATVGQRLLRLEDAAAYRIQRSELVAGIVQRVAALDPPPRVDESVEHVDILAGQPARQAQLAKIATRAARRDLRGTIRSRLYDRQVGIAAVAVFSA